MNNLNSLKNLIKDTTGIEIEIKLGKFINTQFTADVNEVIFYKLIEYLENDYSKSSSKCIMCNNNKNRIELFLNNENEIISYEEIEKKKLKNYDFPKLNMRLTASREILISKSNKNIQNTIKNKYLNIGCFRYKDRISFLKGIWRFDLTKVYDINSKTTYSKFLELISKNNLSYRYEAEIEYIGDFTHNLKKELEDIHSKIIDILNYNNYILDSIKTILKNKEFNVIKNLNTNKWSSKQLMTSVQNLNLISLNNIINSKINYSITEKADGERYLLYIQNNMIYVIDKSLNLNFINNSNNLIQKSIPSNLSNNIYLFDVEYIPENNLYLIFDCIIFDEKDISLLPLDKRIKHIEKIKWDNNKIFKMKKHHLSNKKDFFNLCKKVYTDIKYDYDIDGLIFTPIEEQYRTNVYKWKPPEQQTIDFFILIKYQKVLNRNITELILDLYVTTSSNKFKYNKSLFRNISKHSRTIPFLFSKNNRINIKNKNGKMIYQIDNREVIIENKTIIEMRFIEGSWKPFKNRFDKDKEYRESIKKGIFDGPNGFYVAKFVMDLINKPITTEMITSGQIYFTGINKKNSQIRNMIKFNNMIKDSMYMDYLKADMKLLELSGGRGGDLYRFLSKKPSYIFFTNYAKDALQEAKRRYNDFIKKNSDLKTNIIFEEYNLRENVSNNISKKISETKFDLISCQFAINYFLETEKIWNNFFKNIKLFIKKGGIFMFTCFDGKRIQEKLKKNKKNDKLELKIKNKRVLGFTKLYDGRKKSVFGKELGCFVETIGEHNEYLVDIDYLIKCFEDNDFKLIENSQFDSLFESFNIKLLDVEKEFTGLYNKVILQKI